MKSFKLVKDFKGYVNKSDITNIDASYLVSPSQNVMVNDGEKVVVRNGTSLLGAANAALTPILSSYDWVTSTAHERNLRKYDVELEVLYNGTWVRLDNSSFTAAADLKFAEYWSTTESKDLLIIVDGTSTMHMWSGGITTFASATTNTITKQGTTTWAEERFLVAGTRSVVINGTEYAYTGGESTTTLTGVTPDPTAAGHAVASVVLQVLRAHANTPASGVNNDIIIANKNQLYVADLNRRDVYVSKNTDYTSFTFTSPTRIPGEGGLLTLDSTPVGFAVQEDFVYISGAKNDWYQTKFTLSSTLTAETLTVDKLKTTPGQAALSQSAIGNIKNSILYVTTDLVVDTLSRIENVDTPQSLPISDPIKNELIAYDTTIKPDIKFFKNQTFITFPSESKVLIYDHARGYWQPPQILGIRKFAIIAGVLHGHSNSVPETYKIFEEDVFNDNTNPIYAKAYFAYRLYGERDWQKECNEFFIEGYISPNTTITAGHKSNFGGFSGIQEFDISGTDTAILFSTVSDGSLGKNPLGSNPIGSITDSASDLQKFRVIKTFTKQQFYEHQMFFESNDVDFQWELIAFGANVMLSTADNNSIKQ